METEKEQEEKLPNVFNNSSKDFSTWKLDFTRFKIIKIIGSGAYGTVCEGVDLSTGKSIAIKRITNLFIYPIETKRVLREITLLRLLTHPNIVKLLEVLIEGDPLNFNTIYMIMEYFPSDLKRLYYSSLYLNSFQIETIMYQACQALDYLHSCQILHRDIKPANILINEECTIKICDFGLAKSIVTSEDIEFEDKLQKSYSPRDIHDKILVPKQYFAISANNSPEKPANQKNFNPDPKLSSLTAPKKDSGFNFLLKEGLEEELIENKLTPKLNCEMLIELDNPTIFTNKTPLKKNTMKLTKHVVSRWYRPPEIILIEPLYTEVIDIWSLGCVFAELQRMIKLNLNETLNRTTLFPGSSCFPLSPEIKKNKKKLVVKGKNDQLKVIFDILGTPGERESEFITDANSLSYLKSFKLKEKKEFKTLFPASSSDAIDLLQKMLKFNPNERISSRNALNHEFFKKIKGKRADLSAVKQKICLKCDQPGFSNVKKIRGLFLEELNFYKNGSFLL